MTNKCAQEHRIYLSNVYNEDNLPHAVVLLKGTIKNYCSLNVIIVENQESGESFQSVEIRRQRSIGSFKCLIRLQPNANHLNLRYCNYSKKITLNFIKSDQEYRYVVKIYYVICEGHDGCFQIDHAGEEDPIDKACNRINLGIELIQCLFSEKLFECGMPRRTFQFIPCQTFYSTLNIQDAKSWQANEVWTALAKEFVASETDTALGVKYVGLIACTRYLGLALGAGDVAIYGTGCLYTWPDTLQQIATCFNDKTPVDSKILMDDSNNRHTYGGCYATTLGSLCHEMGHIFDLGHTRTGIMGNGFDFINRVFTYETTTVVLPPRIVPSCQSLSLQGSNVKDSRLTKIKQNNQFLLEYQNQKDNDLTFFCENSMITVFYHKWFSQTATAAYQIVYDYDTRKITSKLPIRLIEFREKSNALTSRYFAFHNVDHVFGFHVPDDALNCDCDIFVLDDNGNVERIPSLKPGLRLHASRI